MKLFTDVFSKFIIRSALSEGDEAGPGAASGGAKPKEKKGVTFTGISSVTVPGVMNEFWRAFSLGSLSAAISLSRLTRMLWAEVPMVP